MAHSIWWLHEIVSAIAANLVSDMAKASAVALARCSRSLEGPVLSEVWRSLSGLTPLVKCFPPGVWNIEYGHLFFKRAPLLAEWTRFQQQYASKVRHLEVYNSNISHVTLQVLQLYSHPSPLLPNLRSIDWKNDEILSSVTLFFSHSLTSIVITVEDPPENSIVPPILMRLSAMSPNISKIAVRGMTNDPSLKETSSQLLTQCSPSLRSYSVDAPLSDFAVRHAIQLSSLEEFRFKCPIHFPDPLPAVVFPSLRLISVGHSGDLMWLTKLLPAIQSPVFSGICVDFKSDGERLMESIQLTVMACGMHERLKEFTLRSISFTIFFKITPEIIAYNSSFKNLTSLRLLSECINGPCRTLDLTDKDIDLLTNAMPGLKKLSIGKQPCAIPSKITFKSLNTISRRCTGLKSLRIHFDPNSFVEALAAPGSGNVGLLDHSTSSSDLCSVTKINVGYIPFQRRDSYIMALGLLGVFPRLQKVKYRGPASGWEEIANLIAIFGRIHSALPK